MALVAMGLGVIVIANDFTALNVALPAIEGDLNVDVGTAQWVINAYCLVFGMAIVTGGRLADLSADAGPSSSDRRCSRASRCSGARRRMRRG